MAMSYSSSLHKFRQERREERVFTKVLNIFHNILKAHVGINGIIIIHGLFVLRHWLAIIHVLFWVSETDKTIENSRFWFESIGVRDSDTNLNARNHDCSKEALLERRNV